MKKFFMAFISIVLVVIAILLFANLTKKPEVKEPATVKVVKHEAKKKASKKEPTTQKEKTKADVNAELYDKVWDAKDDNNNEVKVIFKKDGTYDWLFYARGVAPNFQSESGKYTINSEGHIELATIDTRASADYHVPSDILEVAPKEEPEFVGVGNDEDEQPAQIDSSMDFQFWFRNGKLHSGMFYHKDFTVLNEQLPSAQELGNKVREQYKALHG